MQLRLQSMGWNTVRPGRAWLYLCIRPRFFFAMSVRVDRTQRGRGSAISIGSSPGGARNISAEAQEGYFFLGTGGNPCSTLWAGLFPRGLQVLAQACEILFNLVNIALHPGDGAQRCLQFALFSADGREICPRLGGQRIRLLERVQPRPRQRADLDVPQETFLKRDRALGS